MKDEEACPSCGVPMLADCKPWCKCPDCKPEKKK